jgi:hypothetical protein
MWKRLGKHICNWEQDRFPAVPGDREIGNGNFPFSPAGYLGLQND